jgi:membrane-bound lytic murein transglycosylase MltF
LLAACSKAPPPATAVPAGAPPAATAKEAVNAPAAPAPVAPPTPTPAADVFGGSAALPIMLPRRTGDLEGMLRERSIRALVVTSRTDFFYDRGHPRGIVFEFMEEFQRFLNTKLRTGALKTTVTFIPVRPEQLEAALLQGVGDIVATDVLITPEREQRVLFSAPLATDLKQILVTGPAAPPVASVEDLAGVEVFASPLTVAYAELQKLSARLQQAGKAPIKVRAADKNLSLEDLLEMVDAGLIPATVTGSRKAQFWSKVFTHLQPHPDIVVHADGAAAFAMRKDSPHLKALLDEFVAGHGLGTSFGNTLLRRYLQNTKYVKNSVSKAELEKFRSTVGYFRKYAAQYDFDYLMLAAQGYQESMLDQSRRSRSGAVGIMQVIPKYAAAKPISIKDVSTAESNIQAGTKMLRNIQDTYFQDSDIDALNKTLLSFASYNAGPARIARLRKVAQAQGLDPDVWFGNVDQVVAKDIGQETVVYVSNIYKYYIAYKLTLEEAQPATPGSP